MLLKLSIHLTNIYWASGTVLGTKNILLNKADKSLCPCRAYIVVETNIINKYILWLIISVLEKWEPVRGLGRPTEGMGVYGIASLNGISREGLTKEVSWEL